MERGQHSRLRRRGYGDADVSPRGDAPGFVQVLDEKTLVIPDRPGNRRIDTLRNILQQPHVGLLFLIPGQGEQGCLRLESWKLDSGC